MQRLKICGSVSSGDLLEIWLSILRGAILEPNRLDLVVKVVTCSGLGGDS